MVTEAVDNTSAEERSIMEGKVIDVRLLAIAICGNAIQQADAKCIIRKQIANIEYPFLAELLDDKSSKPNGSTKSPVIVSSATEVHLAMSMPPMAYISSDANAAFQMELPGTVPAYSKTVVDTLRAEINRLREIIG